MNSVGVRPARLDLRAYQGDSYVLTVTVEQNNAEPVNLTGKEAELSIAVARGARPAHQYTTEGPYVEVTDPENGVIEVFVPEKETKRWRNDRYVYEFTIRDDSGYAQTLLTGGFRVTREVKG